MSDATEVVAFSNPDARRRVVMLEYPVTCAGVLYDRIVIRRPTVRDIREWAAQIEAARKVDAPLPNLPMIEGEVPPQVMDALDPDDDDKIEAAIEDFLPRRFRDAMANAQVRELAAASSPSSAEH